MSLTYLTTEELSGRIKYDPRTIRNCLKDILDCISCEIHNGQR